MGNTGYGLALTVRSERYMKKTFLAYCCLVVLFLVVTSFILLSVKHVTVEFDGRQTSYYTLAPTVSSVLKELSINKKFGLNGDPALLKEGESLNFYTLSKELDKKITNGMNITISSHRIDKIAKTRDIPTTVQKEWDITLDPGKQKIVSPGKNGVIKDTILVYYRDGKMTGTTKVQTQVLQKPRPKVIAFGSYEIASRQGLVRGGVVRKFEATAYTYTGYRTATGLKTRRGIVAVDPRVIPLGTKLYVEGYGPAVAADTGGAIKGNRIDVFLESESAARKWGRRYVNVHIVRKK